MLLPVLQPDAAAPVLSLGLLTTTRYCWAGCAFCRLAKPVPDIPLSEAPAGLTVEQIDRAPVDWRSVQHLKLRGGLSLREPFDYWIHLVRDVKRRSSSPLTVFSPVEIWQYHIREKRSIRELLGLLKWAGADYLGPGGSETWNEDLRSQSSPYRMRVDEWVQVARTAEDVGLAYTAAMMVVPRMTESQWDDYVKGLQDLHPAYLELKPLMSGTTAWARHGDAHLLEVSSALRRMREVWPALSIYVREDLPSPDAAEVLGASGASAVLVPGWEIAP